MGGGYKLPRLCVEIPEKEVKNKILDSEKSDFLSEKEMTNLREKIRAPAQPALKNSNNKILFCSRKRPSMSANMKCVESGSKRPRKEANSTPAGGKLKKSKTTSTPAQGSAVPKLSQSSLSSIEDSAPNPSGLSDPSDCSLLNSVMDNLGNRDNLSNSSDYEILVNATQEAELMNHRDLPVFDTMSSGTNSVSSAESCSDQPCVKNCVRDNCSCDHLMSQVEECLVLKPSRDK